MVGVPAAAAPTFTIRLNALTPPLAPMVAEDVQVTIWDAATHDQTPELVLLLNVKPVGRVSVAVLVPVVASVPVLVTVIV